LANIATIAGVQAAQTGAIVATRGLWTNPTTPNLTDFETFLSTSVLVPTAALPADSPWPQYALNRAIRLVLRVPGCPSAEYVDAVYNCATHVLLSIAVDQPGQSYFTGQRAREGLALIVPPTPIVIASSDEQTSQSTAEPDWASGLTIGQLDFFKSPWGRVYLNHNQSYGPAIWGLT
jgi:hypothetical protein